MKYVSEIYLTKDYIEKEEWNKLINVISNYNGMFKKWRISIINKNNQIRYYINTKCRIPPIINNLDSYMFKTSKKIKKPISNYTIITLPKIGNNILDLINYYEIKKKSNLLYIEIDFIKIYENKIITNIKHYIYKNNKIIKHRLLYGFPDSILSVNFTNNKRIYYKKIPKYLEITKIIHLLNTNKENSALLIDTFPYIQGEFYLKQNNYNFDKHSLILGSSGSGKSKLVSLLIKNIYINNYLKQKYKIIVIDPHASLENDLGGIGKTIDFQIIENSIDLFINNNDNIVSSTELLLELFKSIISNQYNSKVERVLRHSINLLLIDKSFNFKNLRKIILDIEYRNEIISEHKENISESTLDFYLGDFNELKTKSYTEAISPIIAFIDELEMIPVLNNNEKKKNLEETIKNNFLTLFSLNRTKIGEKNTKTIAGLIMQQILLLVQKKEIEEHIIFIIDEVPIIENPILSRFLSESRKYNLSLFLIGQYFNQISNELKNAIFSNVINYYIFRVSKIDANAIVDNINIKLVQENTKENQIKLLNELNSRECIVRIESNDIILPAFKAKTTEYKSISRIKEKNQLEKVQRQQKILKEELNIKIDNINLKDILKSTSTSRKELG